MSNQNTTLKPEAQILTRLVPCVAQRQSTDALRLNLSSHPNLQIRTIVKSHETWNRLVEAADTHIQNSANNNPASSPITRYRRDAGRMLNVLSRDGHSAHSFRFCVSLGHRLLRGSGNPETDDFDTVLVNASEAGIQMGLSDKQMANTITKCVNAKLVHRLQRGRALKGSPNAFKFPRYNALSKYEAIVESLFTFDPNEETPFSAIFNSVHHPGWDGKSDVFEMVCRQALGLESRWSDRKTRTIVREAEQMGFDMLSIHEGTFCADLPLVLAEILDGYSDGTQEAHRAVLRERWMTRRAARIEESDSMRAMRQKARAFFVAFGLPGDVPHDEMAPYLNKLKKLVASKQATTPIAADMVKAMQSQLLEARVPPKAVQFVFAAA